MFDLEAAVAGRLESEPEPTDPAHREWQPQRPCRLNLCDGSGWVHTERQAYSGATHRMELVDVALRCKCRQVIDTGSAK